MIKKCVWGSLKNCLAFVESNEKNRSCNTEKAIILWWSHESLKQNLLQCIKVKQPCPFLKKPSLSGYLLLHGLIFSVPGSNSLIVPSEFF